MRTQPQCPECEKLTAVSEESNKIGAFMDWLSSQGVVLCAWEDNDDDDTSEYLPHLLMPVNKYRGNSGINQALADYYEIDLNKVEKERRALLDWLREV